jgi:hypothetical protein
MMDWLVWEAWVHFEGRFEDVTPEYKHCSNHLCALHREQLATALAVPVDGEPRPEQSTTEAVVEAARRYVAVPDDELAGAEYRALKAAVAALDAEERVRASREAPPPVLTEGDEA